MQEKKVFAKSIILNLGNDYSLFNLPQKQFLEQDDIYSLSCGDTTWDDVALYLSCISHYFSIRVAAKKWFLAFSISKTSPNNYTLFNLTQKNIFPNFCMFWGEVVPDTNREQRIIKKICGVDQSYENNCVILKLHQPLVFDKGCNKKWVLALNPS